MNCGMWNDVCVDHWWQMYVTLNHRENSVTHHYSDVWSNSPWIFIRNHGRDDWIHTSLYNVLLCLEINGAMWTGHENSRSIMFSKSGCTQIGIFSSLYLNQFDTERVFWFKNNWLDKKNKYMDQYLLWSEVYFVNLLCCEFNKFSRVGEGGGNNPL